MKIVSEDSSVAGLTTGAVARRLGVSPTTLRSWDRRYGLGPAQRSQGHHRRWGGRDVAMLEEMCRLTAQGASPAEAARVARLRQETGTEQEAGRAAGFSPKAVAEPGESTSPGEQPAQQEAPSARPRGGAGGGLPLGDVRQECRGLSRAAVRLDAPELQRRLLQAVRQHGVTEAWEEIMVPTLRAVGRKWESSGDRYVEVEHMLSWQISTALRRAALVVEPVQEVPPGARPVVLACVPGEQHSLPLEALEAALGPAGVPTRMLGAAVPVEALLACVRRTGPTAVVLWAQTRSAASVPLARHVADLRWGGAGARSRPLVLPVGPGWDRRSIDGFPKLNCLADAVRSLAGLYEADGTVLRSPRDA